MTSPPSAASATPSGARMSASNLTDYVLEHPPVYDGPPRPADPNAPPGPQPGERAPSR